MECDDYYAMACFIYNAIAGVLCLAIIWLLYEATKKAE